MGITTTDRIENDKFNNGIQGNKAKMKKQKRQYMIK